MRILQVCEGFGGGALDSVVSICSALSGWGDIELHLCIRRRKETPESVQSLVGASVTVHELPGAGHGGLMADLGALFVIRRIAARLRPDVVHLHSSKAGFLGRVALSFGFPKTKVFYTPQGWAFLRRDVSRPARWVFRLLERVGRTCGGVVVGCCASETALTPPAFSGSNHGLATVDNAVFGVYVREAVGPLRSSSGRLRVGTLGRLTPQKDPRLFAEVCRRLRDLPVDWVWIGGGDAEYQSLLERVGVKVTGWLPQHTALAELANLDIYLQTSGWEGMPIAVLQALHVGIPAVVTNVPGNNDAVGFGKWGLVADDATGLADGIRTLVSDRELRERLGSAGRAVTLDRFSERRYHREILELYGVAASGAECPGRSTL